MFKKDIIVATLFFIAIYHNVSAQTYTVQTFEHTSAKISLTYKLLSKTLAVSCLDDTLYLNEYTGTAEARVVNKKFLLIVYNIRGGTGAVYQNTLIVSVSKNKIISSSLVSSYAYSFSPDNDNKTIDIEKSYRLKSTLVDKANDYQLIIDIHDERTSKSGPSDNYENNNKVTLSFDVTKHIFYSKRKKIADYFTIYNSQNQSRVKKFLYGTFPTIKLGRIEYYFINNYWYEVGAAKNLIGYSYRKSA